MTNGKFALDLKAQLNSADLKKQIEAISKTQKIRIDATGTEKIVKETQKWRDSNDRIITQVKTIDKNTGQLTTTLKTVNTNAQKLNQSFGDIVLKVGKFLLATTIISGFTSAMYGAVDVVFEFDKALTEFKKISDLSGDSLTDYIDKLGELGKTVSRTKIEMLEASTEFAKAGYTEDESAILAQTASLFQNIADSQLSASDASSIIISQLKAFNLTAEDSIRVIDVINEVSNKYAVSSTDLSLGLSKTASAMATMGNTIEQSVSLMVGAGEQMPHQSGKIARGLRSIALEINKYAQENEYLKTSLGDVSLYDEQTGALKSTFQVMSDLYPLYQKMSNEERTQIGLLLAGKTQYEVFSATMNGFNNVLSANETALNSSGSAMTENARYMESISAHLNALKAEFQDLSLNIINSDFIKALLDAGTSILKFANSDIGQAIIKFSLLSGAIALVIGAFTKLTSTTGLLYNAFVALVPLFVTYNAGMTVAEANLARLAGGQAVVASSTISLATGFKALTAVMLKSPLFIGGAIIATIFGVAKAIDASNKKIAESIKANEANTAQIEVQTKSYQELKNSIDESNKSYKETTAETQTNASLGKQYLDIIKKLNSEEELNAYQKEQMRSAVVNLNKIYPSLNLQIDKATGKVVNFTDALYDNIEALKQQAIVVALQKNIDKLTETYAQATLSKEKYDDLLTKTPSIAGGEGAIVYGESSHEWLKSQSKKLKGELSDLDASLKTQTDDLTKKKEKLQTLLDEFGLGDKKPSSGPTLKTPTDKSNKKEIDALTQLREAYNEVISAMEHQLFLAEKQGVSQAQQITMIGDIQAELHKQSEYYRKILPNAKAEDKKALEEYLKDNQKLWWKYADDIKTINDKIAEDAKKAREESLNAELNLHNAQLKALERYAKEQQALIQIQIDGIDREIEALEKENAEREKAIQLQQLEENLASAKQMRVKVFEGGKGFVYQEDVGAISEAQTAIDEFNQEQIHQAKLDYLNSEKLALQEQKEEWSNYITNYKDEQDRLLNEIELGMTEEQYLNGLKLDNIKSFANQYIATINSIIEAQRQLNSITSGGKSSGKKSKGGGGSTLEERRADAQKTQQQGDASKKKGYANGITSIPFDQWANVNEKGDELFIPPKGNMEYLQKGTGVIPKTLTENIMEMGKIGINGIKNLMSPKSQGMTVYNQFDKIVLPNVTNAETFLNELKNFKNLATQTAFTRT